MCIRDRSRQSDLMDLCSRQRKMLRTSRSSRPVTVDTILTTVLWFEREGRGIAIPVSYTHLRAHETPEHLVCRLLLEKKKKHINTTFFSRVIHSPNITLSNVYSLKH
eukprot:TRINITY_DN20990_c0_g1_i1.p1 TRINITY_DN20990_c0_g1~~TRINITY_DN20990_c0_g1_i1.p1  ORF type:complete len:107 (+),score=17.01 TRINITY_DN20990_c0_g1_i1:178-498(+)